MSPNIHRLIAGSGWHAREVTMHPKRTAILMISTLLPLAFAINGVTSAAAPQYSMAAARVAQGAYLGCFDTTSIALPSSTLPTASLGPKTLEKCKAFCRHKQASLYALTVKYMCTCIHDTPSLSAQLPDMSCERARFARIRDNTAAVFYVHDDATESCSIQPVKTGSTGNLTTVSCGPRQGNVNYNGPHWVYGIINPSLLQGDTIVSPSTPKPSSQKPSTTEPSSLKPALVIMPSIPKPSQQTITQQLDPKPFGPTKPSTKQLPLSEPSGFDPARPPLNINPVQHPQTIPSAVQYAAHQLSRKQPSLSEPNGFDPMTKPRGYSANSHVPLSDTSGTVKHAAAATPGALPNKAPSNLPTATPWLSTTEVMSNDVSRLAGGNSNSIAAVPSSFKDDTAGSQGQSAAAGSQGQSAAAGSQGQSAGPQLHPLIPNAVSVESGRPQTTHQQSNAYDLEHGISSTKERPASVMASPTGAYDAIATASQPAIINTAGDLNRSGSKMSSNRSGNKHYNKETRGARWKAQVKLTDTASLPN
eukprot:jgi/Chrzof1/10341/Cz04g38150.t1